MALTTDARALLLSRLGRRAHNRASQHEDHEWLFPQMVERV
jgi:hypothetical protein